MLVAIQPPEFDVDLYIAYATEDNFTGKPAYKRPLCFLHQDAAECLKKAVTYAAALGLRVKVFDGYRPQEVQAALWEHTPDENFLSHPVHGVMPHCRGIAVDLTLIDANGKELDMGTAFDAFTPLSYHGNMEVSEEAQRNRFMFLGLMAAAGFKHNPREWWHYQLRDHDCYPVLKETDAQTGML